MKLPDYAKHLGISYKTAWRWWRDGKLPHPARQTETGMVIVDFNPAPLTVSKKDKAAIYARVSAAEDRSNLDDQAERLTQYAIAKGYTIVRVVKEVGSGLNDNRKKLEGLLMSFDYDILIVERKDRLARFGTHYLDIVLSRCGVTLEIVNLAENGRDELMEDLISILSSFSSRLYRQKRAKRKIETIIKQLQEGDGDETS
jgi:putative resolvase